MKKIKLKLLIAALLILLAYGIGGAQAFTTTDQANMSHLVPPSNIDYAGLEKDILLYADTRYQVSQTGSAQLNLAYLFDGKYLPSYTTSAPSESDPTVILIENLPANHTQRQAWVGWSTRYEPMKKFKIEGYKSQNPEGWVIFANVDNNTSHKYIVSPPGGAYTKLRFTIYHGYDGKDGKFGLSEIFFLHSEIAQAYDGLMVKYQHNGNVLIGKTTQTNPSYKLDINGNIRADKVVVNTTGADYVFDSTYSLSKLDSIENFIKVNHHLPGIIEANLMKREGIDIGQIQTKLLEKIEELTLYIIEINKKQRAIEKRIEELTKTKDQTQCTNWKMQISPR